MHVYSVHLPEYLSPFLFMTIREATAKSCGVGQARVPTWSDFSETPMLSAKETNEAMMRCQHIIYRSN